MRHHRKPALHGQRDQVQRQPQQTVQRRFESLRQPVEPARALQS